MRRQSRTKGWIALALVLAAGSLATVASFSDKGMQVEAGGVEMTVKASVKGGVQLFFAAA